MDTTNVVSWSIHEKWVDTLFRAYSSESSAATRPVSLTRVLHLSTAKKKACAASFFTSWAFLGVLCCCEVEAGLEVVATKP